MLLVGDDHGGITVLKLSPNLRRGAAAGAAAAASSGASLAPGATWDHPACSTAQKPQGTASSTGAGTALSMGTEAARLEAVLAVAHKCNAALAPADWELL